MKSSILYTVAQPMQYALAYRLMKEEGVPHWKLDFPTVFAWEGSKLIGFVGTSIKDKMIIAGPLVVRRDRRRLFTILRLSEAYEQAMVSLGIKAFIMSADVGSIFDRAMDRYCPDIKPFAIEDGKKFWSWHLDGKPKGLGSASHAGGEGTPEEPSGTSGSAATDNRAGPSAE